MIDIFCKKLVYFLSLIWFKEKGIIVIFYYKI
jgi:hypothetical protein